MKKFIFALFTMVALNSFGAVTVSVNGSNHTIPQNNERGWGTAVTAWIQAISQYTLQPSGGTFTLGADVDFGATYGLKSAYFKTRTANLSTAGVLRLAVSDSIGWRNTANGGNLLLAVNGSDQLTFNGVVLSSPTSGSFQDSTFGIYDNGDSTKIIAFQASGITTGTTRTITMPDSNVDLGGLVNANIASGAAIARTKLASGSASHILVNDGSGVMSSTASLSRTLVATGTASHVLINDGSGVMSSEATLAKSRGGAGADMSSVTFPSSGTIATIAGTQVLTNKDIDGGTASNSSRITIPKDSYANISALTRKEGTIIYGSDTDKLYYDDGSTLNQIGGSWSTSDQQTLADAGTITISTTQSLQEIVVAGNGAAIALSSTPFGTSPPPDGAYIVLIGNSDANSVSITANDASNGCVGNFTTIYLGKYERAVFQYSSTLSRYVYVE